MNVEKEAINFAIQYEIKKGRKPKDVSKTKCGFDIKSSDRDIEVKGSSKKNGFINFSQWNFKGLQQSKNFYLYVVYNIKSEPKLLILNKEEIIKRAKFKYYWEIPLRKEDYKK